MADLTTPTLERAELLLQEGNIREARLLLVEVLKSSPTSASAWWAMSRAVVDEKQVLDCLERTLRYDPNHEQARIRLEQIRNPFSLVSGIPLPGELETPAISSENINDQPQAGSVPFSWESSGKGLPGEPISPVFVSDEQPVDTSSPVLWELPSQVESLAPGEPPIVDHNFSTSDMDNVKEEFDLFASGAFEKYNAELLKNYTPSEVARPWVEELIQTLNASEEVAPAATPTGEVPAWVVPDHVSTTFASTEPMEQPKKGRMSVVEIVLLIILILLVLLVGGYFSLSLLGLV